MGAIAVMTRTKKEALRHRLLWCCACNADVNARLTTGREIYPHRSDLARLPFWRCDACGNFVGCHHQTSNPTAPLGCIPTPQLKEARKHLHALIDPLWQSGRISRVALYKAISDAVGWKYHTAKTRTVEEARIAYKAVLTIASTLEKRDDHES